METNRVYAKVQDLRQQPDIISVGVYFSQT
jgi:hypothetical protein